MRAKCPECGGLSELEPDKVYKCPHCDRAIKLDMEAAIPFNRLNFLGVVQQQICRVEQAVAEAEAALETEYWQNYRNGLQELVDELGY